MELFFSTLSDAGNVRQNNEDSLYAGKIGDDEYLFIVADGMGGHRAGEVASRKAVTVVVRQLEKGPGKNIPESLNKIALKANETLMKEGKKIHAKNGMGTTLSVLYINQGLAYVAHVGDSRIYRYTPSKNKKTHTLAQLTDDHSFVGRLLKDGFLTEEEARNHPRRNVLYQSIGLKKQITVQVNDPVPVKEGEKYLLCSDGLYSVVTEAEIGGFLTGRTTGAAARLLVEKANENGGPDNITVIVVSTEPEPDQAELADGDLLPEDTVKIRVLGVTNQHKKRRKKGIYILIALLALLLTAVVYLLISAGNAAPQTVQPPETTGVAAGGNNGIPGGDF